MTEFSFFSFFISLFSLIFFSKQIRSLWSFDFSQRSVKFGILSQCFKGINETFGIGKLGGRDETVRDFVANKAQLAENAISESTTASPVHSLESDIEREKRD